MVTSSHPKRPRDPNQLAKAIIDIATGQKPDRDSYARGRKENRIGARMNKNVDESSRQTAKMNRERLALPERPAILVEIEKKGGGYPYEYGAPPGAKAGQRKRKKYGQKSPKQQIGPQRQRQKSDSGRRPASVGGLSLGSSILSPPAMTSAAPIQRSQTGSGIFAGRSHGPLGPPLRCPVHL